MLNQTLEFLRIADSQPTDEKVRNRAESAKGLLEAVVKDHNLLLQFVLGVVTEFSAAPFTQESPAVTQLITAIKNQDATLPLDVTENAVELRALAGIVVGELLMQRTNGDPSTSAILAALSLRSALTLRPSAKDKFIRWMLDTLVKASDDVLQTAGLNRRKRGMPSLQKLAALKEVTAATDLWEVVMPVIKKTVREVTAETEVDREEVETLWWMFGAHSELENKPLVDLEPAAAAFCAGIELAERSLLPPSQGATAMVKRAVESGRKPTSLAATSFQDAAKYWSASMLAALAPTDGTISDAIAHYPALLPLSWSCNRLRDSKGGGQKLGKDFTVVTGLSAGHTLAPTDWGAQVFREKVLQRLLSEEF